MASVLAIAMTGKYNVRLIFCLEKEGVLRDRMMNLLFSQDNRTGFHKTARRGIIEEG